MTKKSENLAGSSRETQRLLEERKQCWRDQVIFDSKLSGMTKAVAYAMASWITTPGAVHHESNDNIFVRGTQKALAEMVGCSAKTAHSAMASLIEHGHIELIRRPQGRDDTNLYCIIPASYPTRYGLDSKLASASASHR